MKKAVCLILLLGLLLTCVISCGSNNDGAQASDDQKNDASDVYEKLNKMVSEEYSSLTVRISSDIDGVTLESVYSFNRTSSQEEMSYRIEQLSSFVADDGTLAAPDKQKNTLEGTAIISNGKISSQKGDKVEIDLASVGLPKFNFKASNFSEITEGSNSFSATVIDATLFMGKAFSGKDLTVSIDFSDSGISKITLCFVDDGASNTCEYVFN
jgi:hypothetical protein